MINNNIKKIVLSLLILCSVASSKALEYSNEDSFKYLDVKPFVGIEIGWAYMKDASRFDSTIEAYGYYVGLPIRQYEIIVKRKFSDSKDFTIDAKSVTFNMPIDGSGTDLFYFGLIGGEAKVRWANREVSRFSIQEQTIKDKFYGVHIGNKYKFHRNFYVKIELEYLNYDIADENLSNDVYIDKSLEFIYGIEYRF